LFCKKQFKSKELHHYKMLVLTLQRCLYWHYKVLVLMLQDACTGTTRCLY